MKRLCGALCWIVLLTVIVPLGYRATRWLLRYDWEPKADAVASEAGRDLFLHEWTPGDPLAAKGDGLGPVFNASSCAACHQQGGAGGSGSMEHNVTVFTRAPKAGAGATRGVIHQFAIDAASQETLQNISSQFPKKSRPTLADLTALLPKPANPSAGVQPIRAVTVAIPEIDMGQRNTPSLFGASVIDAIPDAAILANERNQRLKLRLSAFNGGEIPAGRAAKLSRKRIGKFGWKANIGNLAEFVRVACANELGLGNPLQAQPASLSQPEYRPRGLDLTDQQCDQMTAFIASLPRPREVIPASAAEAARAVAGKQHFKQIGCINCHTADLAEAQGIYSDLLLHQMGEGLGGGGSYGEEPSDPSADPDSGGDSTSPSEWRTPPLWGIADSAPYLHDGRAATLAEAIKLHAGQASSSANRFEGLSDVQQEELVAFLNTLRAPSLECERPQMVKGQIANRSAARSAFGNLFKVTVAPLDADSFPLAANSSRR